MWDLANRGIIVLVSVLTGCIVIYNTWGPILAVIISLFFVIYACYSLIVNDSLISPQLLIFIHYLKEATFEITQIFDHIAFYIVNIINNLWKKLLHHYRELKMDGRRGHQFNNMKNSSRLSLQFTPIQRTKPKSSFDHDLEVENDSYNRCNALDNPNCHQSDSYNKFTSTPIFSSKKLTPRNGDLVSNRSSIGKKISPMYTQNHTLARGENTTYFSPEGSPWGMSISPKMRPKAAGLKTVQSAAGPLLASTRYNILPKIHYDATSPGITARVTRYATEVNHKVIRQPQYGVGQFPRVNMNASQVPMMSAKTVRARMPVTIRVAPPEASRNSPPERLKALSNLSHNLDNPSSISTPSVVQVLREISLKRHASREDVTTDLVKKQRTDLNFDKPLENPDEIKQKRSRDESKSDEEISPRNKTGRLTKKTKTPSCYDILSSLSSSIDFASGVKRKAGDIVPSETSESTKHYKSSKQETKTAQSVISLPSPTKRSLEIPVIGDSSVKVSTDDVSKKSSFDQIEKESNTKNSISFPKPVELTDKLFMKAEPQTNERLKSMIEEQSFIKAKFTTEDLDEIKKEDIVNMRQTSMRARLQSMFDAISGKASSKFNPDVVIKAEEMNPPVSTTSSQEVCATLNSRTMTTNVNISPISTSAVTPIISTPNPSIIKSPKRVSFNLPNSVDAEKAQSNTINTNSIDSTVDSSNLTFANPISTTPIIFGSNTSSVATTSSIQSTPSFTSTPPKQESPVVTTNLNFTSIPKPTETHTFTKPITSSSFTFGNPTPAITTISDSNTTNSKPSLSFQSAPETSIFQNNSITNSTCTTASFSFGTSSAPSFQQSSGSEWFTFGTNKSISPNNTQNQKTALTTTTVNNPVPAFNTSSKPTTTTPSFSFGTSTSTTTHKPLFSFGTTSTSTSITTSPSTTPSIPALGSVNNNNPTTTLSFGSQSTSPFVNAAVATVAPFGTTNSPSLFGATPKPTGTMISPAIFTKTPTNPSIMDSSVIVDKSATPFNPSFGVASTTAAQLFTNTTTTTTPIFGTGSNIFAQNKTNTTFGSSSLFGTKTSTSSTTFNPTTTNTMTFGNANTSSTSPIFGNQLQTNTSSSTFGSPMASTNFGTSNTSNTGFGMNPTAAGSFSTNFIPKSNTSTPLFGNDSNVNTFNNNSATPLFGSQAKTTTTNTFTVPNTSTSTFSSIGNNNTEGTFCFGGNQTTNQQNSIFSFGGNNSSSNNNNNVASNNNSTATTTATSEPFQFGAVKPAAGGFNFTAPTSAPVINFGAANPPSFNSPTAGMFSIGSGSTASRRTNRSRKTR